MGAEDLSRDNIETFNLIVGMVFADLYAQFPLPMTLSAFHYAHRAGLVDDSMMDVEHEKPVYAAIGWIVEEGFVRSGTPNGRPGYYEGCVLTLQGLRLLSIPSVIGGKETFGEGLVKATSEGVKAGVTSTVSGMVRGALIEGGKMLLQASIQAMMQNMK